MTTADAPALSDAPARREALGLKLSAAGALVLAVVGIVWGLAVSSQVILFDGLYSVIGFVLAWFGLRAATLVQRGPTPHYPFGREALAPLVVAVQALVLLGTFGYAAIDAVGVILHGGSRRRWARPSRTQSSPSRRASLRTSCCCACNRGQTSSPPRRSSGAPRWSSAWP